MKSLRRGPGLSGLLALEVVENLSYVGVESDRSECRPLIPPASVSGFQQLRSTRS